MRKSVFTAFLFFELTASFAQRLQYSRGTVPSPFADAVQLVANVDGFHHLLFFNAGKKPLLYVFDAALQVYAKTEVDVKLKENCDVRLLSLNKHYCLYLHVPGTSQHQLFSIESNGEAKDVSTIFTNPADSAWNRSTATFQLFNTGNKLCVLAHTYFPTIKKMISRIVLFNDELMPVQVSKLFIPYDTGTESLQQVILAGKSLLVLKTGRHEDKGTSLDILKIDTASGDAVLNSFSGGSQLYSSPGLFFNAADSSILLYSVLHESFNSPRQQRFVFLSHLDYSLHEKTPLALLRSQFRNNVAASFLLVNTPQPYWLSMMPAVRFRRAGSRFANPQALEAEDALNIAAARNYSVEQNPDYNTPTAVRFTVLSDLFKTIKDTLVANNGAYSNVQSRPFAQFQTKNKAYLLLIENLSAKRKGLVLLSNSERGGLTTNSLPVFDRYDYLLPQLQTLGNDGFILPYSYKNEFGLLKVTLTE